MNYKLAIDSLIIIDDSGMPQPPTTRQLIDKDVRELYRRDKSKEKKNYIAECIVIYYLGDPKSPARQAGLSEAEALRMAIEQAGLERDYIPDSLVLKLIKRYYNENITEAGRVVENMIQTMHNINLMVSQINNLINEKLNHVLTLEETSSLLPIMDNFKKQASDMPGLLKKLEEAKQNLMYEQEAEISRGGGVVLSSMRAED